MQRAGRTLAALLAAALFLAPAAALAAPEPTSDPGARTPDFARLETNGPDRPVRTPDPVRAPLAAPGNWTVLVYMVADNNLESFGIQDLNEMEAAPAAEGVRVVVEVDRSSSYDTTFGDWSEARRYLIQHDTDASALTSTLLASLGEVDMGDPQVLADFLAWGTTTYPAEHTMVVLWDHGFAWRGFGDDYGQNDHLSLPEMREALEAGAEALGRPFDVLAFDACLMQSAEVGYEFGWVADFFVAAQDLEPGPGWPYDKVLSPLAADPTIAPEDLALAITQAYLDHYGEQGEAMMAAVRLQDVRTTLTDALNALAVDIAGVAEDPATLSAASAAAAVWDARDASPAMYASEMVDLGEFLRHLSEDGRLPQGLRLDAALAREALNTSIVGEGHSVYYAGWSGMSVHFPTFQVAPQYAQGRFAVETFWDEGLTALLTGLKAGGARPTVQVQSPAPGSPIGPRFSASAIGAAGAGEAVQVQYKAGWHAFETIASGPAPASFSGLLDARHAAGPWPLAFRTLSSSGVPSATVERIVIVEPSPATLSPAIFELTLAVNRTRTANLTAAPRVPYQSFDIGWIGLPANISGAGTTGSASFTQVPAPSFNITLTLTVAAGSGEGTFAATLFVRSALSPSVATFVDIVLRVTQPVPDLAVAPLALSNELPLPGEIVNATTAVQNAGLEDATAARVVADFTDVNGTLTEVGNLSVGPLPSGASFSWAGNFTAGRGSQTLRVRAVLEAPLLGELNLSNNEAVSTVVVVNFSVALRGPAEPVLAALGGAPTPVAIEVLNRGTENDNYDLTTANITNSTWQAGLRATGLFVPGRGAGLVVVDVLPPPAAQGGDEVTFEVRAASQGDSAVVSSALVRIRVNETYAATLRPQPSALTLPARGTENVTLTLQNTGNGVEAFALAIEGADPRLRARLDATSFTLSPGQPGSAHLTLTDGGLTSGDRPYTLEAVAVSTSSGARFSAIISVTVLPAAQLQVDALEPLILADANGTASFHVRVTNGGNTVVLASLAATAAIPGLALIVPADLGRLEPGASAVANGTATFGVAPRAGSYNLSFRAADALTGANATGTARLVVPEVHDLRANLAVAASEGPVLVRKIVVENHGNTPELVTFVGGAVPVWATLLKDPANDTFVVEPGDEMTLTLRIAGTPPATGASGSIEVILKAQGGTLTLPFQVTYDYTAPPPPPVLEWVAVAGAAAAGIGAWVYVTRRRGTPPG